MKCPSCNFIFFRSAKKCPSCNGGLARAGYAEQPDEEFTIYAATASAGLGLDDSPSFGDDDAGLDDSLYAGASTLDVPDDDGDNFDLDLSEVEGESSALAEPALEPEAPVEDTLDFDLGTGEFNDVDVDGMGIDLEIPDETPDLDLGDDVSAPEVDLGDGPALDLDLDLGSDDSEPELDLDLGTDDEDEPEISLDLDLGADEDKPELDLDLGGDTEEDSLDLDLDLGDDDDTPVDPKPAVAADATTEDDGLDLDLEGLELDLDLDSDDDK